MALIQAVRDGNLRLTRKLLLDLGEDVNQVAYVDVDDEGEDIYSVGCTSLHIACYDDHANIVELLLQYYADVNARDDGDRTPYISLTTKTLL